MEVPRCGVHHKLNQHGAACSCDEGPHRVNAHLPPSKMLVRAGGEVLHEMKRAIFGEGFQRIWCSHLVLHLIIKPGCPYGDFTDATFLTGLLC